MRTILPLGALLALSLASCSSSANSLTGPDVEPGRVQEPAAPCELPKFRPSSGTWDSLRMISTATAGCPPVSPSA